MAKEKNLASRRVAGAAFYIGVLVFGQAGVEFVGQGYVAVHQKFFIGWPELGIPSTGGETAVSKGWITLALGTLLTLIAVSLIAWSILRLRKLLTRV